MTDPSSSVVDSRKSLSDKVISAIFTPATITVMITAIIGPIAVSQTNNQLKNKEIQLEVIKQIMEYTDKANFGDINSVKKVEVLSEMVKENHPIFQLDFNQSGLKLAQIYKTIETRKIGTLEDEINATKRQKEEMEKGIRKTERQIEEYIKKLNDLSLDEGIEKEQLAKAIRDFALERDSLQINKELYEKTIQSYNLEKRSLEEENNRKQAQIAQLSRQKIMIEQSLKDYESKMEDSTRNREQLQAQIKKMSSELQLSLSTIQELENSLNQAKQRLKEYSDTITRQEQELTARNEKISSLTNKPALASM